ncbi:hypothetical protein COHA_000984 [Chlorella ohadii]|uniref:Uncharacterized protein n=1 Tax=Chlorella ohadii TaxID=2649997 RepID=A0AAD5DZT3_9CHLO|nr:hypothetical protein COHA_000984 [Chlorella ohadii]
MRVPLACFGLCQASMERRIETEEFGGKGRASIPAGSTFSIKFFDALSISSLIMATDGGWAGSSTLKVAVYTNGRLDQAFPSADTCFEIDQYAVGSCPGGSSGNIVVTCNNWVMDCPILYWSNDESSNTCAPPDPEPEPEPEPEPQPSPSSSSSLPSLPPELPPLSNTTCDAASLMQDVELFGDALSMDGVPAVQPVDGWEECCATCADLPECKAW